jgi:hypothetical protein
MQMFRYGWIGEHFNVAASARQIAVCIAEAVNEQL